VVGPEVVLAVTSPTVWKMDPLRSYDEFSRSLRSFADWLPKEVSGATDLDCVMERNGSVLVLELKPWANGVTVPYGQYKTLKVLDAMGCHVYVIGETGKDVWYVMPLWQHMYDGEYLRKGSQMKWSEENFTRMTKAGLQRLVKRWWKNTEADK